MKYGDKVSIRWGFYKGHVGVLRYTCLFGYHVYIAQIDRLDCFWRINLKKETK